MSDKDEPVTHHLGPPAPKLTVEDYRAAREMMKKPRTMRMFGAKITSWATSDTEGFEFWEPDEE